MKKIILSLTAVSAMAIAGGDFEEVQEPVIEIPAIDNSAFYLGIGIGDATVNDDVTSEEFSATTLMLQAGYQYNEYIALEGRYTFGLNMDYSQGITTGIVGGYAGDFSNWGLYVKPMYPIGDVSLYALLGYGGVMLSDLAAGDAYESGFQWGLGASYAFTESISAFVDYVSLYDNTGFDYRARLDDVNSDTWTLGVSYKF